METINDQERKIIEADTSQWTDNDYFRRYRFRQRVAAFALFITSSAGFAVADKVAGEIVWHGKQTEIVALNEQEHTNGDNQWIVIPGLGVQSGEGIAAVLEDTLGKTGDIAYAQYSDDGISPLELADGINSFVKKQHKTTISFYAHSMGGEIMLRTLPYLNKEFKINTIVFDCTPASIYDAKSAAAPIMGSIAPAYGGGLFTKAATEILNNTVLHENADLSLLDQVKDAFRVTLTGSSPRLWSNQMGILKTTDISDYKEYLLDIPNIYYVMPDNPISDDTVYTRASLAEWQRLLNNSVTTIVVKGGGHANATDRPNEYKQALTPYLDEPLKQAIIYQKYRP